MSRVELKKMGDAARVVVITGATRGLGRAMAEELARLGHTVLGCGRSTEAIEEMARAFGAPHDFSPVDVADDLGVEAWSERLLERYGPPDLLINNAGVINANAPLWKVSAGEFGAVIDVNVNGTANVARHFVPAMIERGSGVIVNFSSG